MDSQVKWHVTALCLILLAAPSLAQAQEVATSFEQLKGLVKNGDSVTVTDPTGGQVKGKIADLSPSSLALLVSGRRRELTEGDVTMIRQRRNDPLTNGALWGGLVGAAIGFGTVAAMTCDGCSWEPASFPLLIGALFGGMGAGVGVGIDALVRGQQVIYSRGAASTPRVRVAPLLDRERKGVFLSLGF